MYATYNCVIAPICNWTQVILNNSVTEDIKVKEGGARERKHNHVYMKKMARKRK